MSERSAAAAAPGLASAALLSQLKCWLTRRHTDEVEVWRRGTTVPGRNAKPASRNGRLASPKAAERSEREVSVAIVGGGAMGRALSGALAAAGVPAPVVRGRAQAVDPLLRYAPVVVLAVPFPAALALVRGRLSGLGGGRVLVDVTNPGMGPGIGPGALAVPPCSAGEVLAAAATGWRVVKAFNTVPAALLPHHEMHGHPVSVPVAGDDPDAKARVSELVRRLGFAAVDAGGIAASRELEALAVLLRRISGHNGLRGRVGIHIGTPTGPPPRSVTRIRTEVVQ
jgi:predicted dinucleotide-binding enzyme